MASSSSRRVRNVGTWSSVALVQPDLLKRTGAQQPGTRYAVLFAVDPHIANEDCPSPTGAAFPLPFWQHFYIYNTVVLGTVGLDNMIAVVHARIQLPSSDKVVTIGSSR